MSTRERHIARLRHLFPDAADPEAAARDRLQAADATAEARGQRKAAQKALDAATASHEQAEMDVAEASRMLACHPCGEGTGGIGLVRSPCLARSRIE